MTSTSSRRLLGRLLALAAAPLLSSAVRAAEPVFAEPAPYAVGQVPEVIALGDLNGDGRLDAVTANTHAGTNAPAGDLSVLLGRRGGAFFHLGEFRTGDRPEGILLVPMDGDEHLDAVTADFDGNSVSILLGDGSGGFAEPLQFPARGRPRALFALDLDGDGDLDLATADYEADRLSFWRGDGNAIIERTGSMPAGNGPEVIAAGNIDSDAHLDLLTVDARGNTVTAFIADGQGSFTARPAHAVGERPRFALLRDLDGDGFDDLIAANHFEETVFIDRNIAGTRFRRQTVIDSGGLDRPLEVVLADVTGDGLGDLLVTWFESDVFTIAAGTEDPFEFAAPTVHATGRGPVGMAVADCDGDGDADVLVANASEDTASVYVSRLVAAPEGSFRRADPNADGGVNLSDAVFVLGHLFAGGSRPSCMKSADMDDNGTLDLGDPIYLLGHLTRGGAPPPAPYPSCGEDATSDGLGCDAHPPCGNRD